MTALEQIREELSIMNPSLALIPDDELIEHLMEQYQGDLDPETYLQSLLQERPVTSPVQAPMQAPMGGKRPFGVGADPSEIGYGEAFVGGVKSMWERTWGPNITYLRGGIAGLMGDEDKAQQLYEQARQQDQAILSKTGYLSFEQATKGPDAGVDTFVKWGLQQAGMSLPYTLMGGVGGLAGRAALKGVMSGGMGAFTGATATFVPQTAAFNIARQQEEVERGNLDEVNEGAAFALALPSAMLEGALYPVLGKLLGPLDRNVFNRVLQQATLGRVAKGSAIGASVEALTEVGQQAIERYQAGLPLDGEEAMREYKEAAAGAAFVGGLFGGATTTAGEVIRTVQPTPKVEEGIQKKEIAKPTEVVVQPEDQKTAALDQAKVEQEKPLNFVVEKQGDKFVVNQQELDEAGNIVSKSPVGNIFNTEEEAKAKQAEVQDQKSKLPEQTFFTKDEIVKENPALGNIINDLEEQGNRIAPHVKQVYFQKNLALAKGDAENVVASGGTAGSVADGWYDRASDYAHISLVDPSKAMETTAHENFHALQRTFERGYQSGLFKEDEQAALDSYFPDKQTIENIPQSVQKGLGEDVMARLRERHADRPLDSREMQAYAFGAYSALKAQGKRMAAPNPVIRAFKRLWDFIKSAGNVFKKNEVNTVQDLFEKARTGEIGKRPLDVKAMPREEVEKLRPKAIAAAEKAAAKGVVPDTLEYALSTVLDREGKSYSSVLPSLPVGDQVVQQSYKRGLGGSRLTNVMKLYTRGLVRKERFPTAQAQEREAASIASDLSEVASNEIELNKQGNYINLTTPEGRKLTIGNQSGRNLIGEYRKESELIGRAYDRLVRLQEEGAKPELALSRVEFREQIRDNNDAFGQKYKLKTSLSEGLAENVSKIGIALDKEHEATYGVINQTPRVVKGEIAEADREVFDDAVEAGYQELKYQLGLGKKISVSGSGWYHKAIRDTIKRVKDIIPQMKDGSLQEQIDKELQFKLFLALFSPQGGPVVNLDVAAQVYKSYLENGVVPEEKFLYTEEPLFGVSHESMLKSLNLVDYLVKKHGKNPGDLENYLFASQTYKELGKEKLGSGFFVPAKQSKKIKPSELKSFLKNNSDYAPVRWTENEIKKGRDGAGNKVPKGANTNTLKTYTNKKTGEITNQVNKELDYSDLSGVNIEAYNKETGKTEDAVYLPAYMFGEKVGTFFLNFNGFEGVTKDRWFSRHYYRQFGQVGIARNPKTGRPLKSETKMVKDISGKMVERTYPPGHDPVTKLRDTPKANDRKAMELYVEAIKERAIADGTLKGKDATKQNIQAIVWYFEQGLFTDLGKKSIPVDYIQAVKVLENKIKTDRKTKGQSYGQFYDTKRIKGVPIDEEAKGREAEERPKLSVSEIKQEAQDYEGNLDEAPAYLKPELSASKQPKQLPLKQIEKPNDGLVSSIEKYKKKLEDAASEETAFIDKEKDEVTGKYVDGPNLYNDYSNTKIPNKNFKYGKLYNHCKACAVAVQDKFGGDIIYVRSMPFVDKNGKDSTSPHYINLINGHYFDVSGQQFGNTNVLPSVDELKGGKTEDDFQTVDIRTDKKRQKTDRIRQFVIKANGETKPTAPVAVTPEFSVTDITLDNLNQLPDISTKFYNYDKLERLPGGTGRRVYIINDDLVMKVANKPRGLLENDAEGDYVVARWLPKFHKQGKDYVITERTARADIGEGSLIQFSQPKWYTPSKKRPTEIAQFLRPLKKFSQIDFDNKTSELQEAMEKLDLSIFLNYDVLWGDFISNRNWGKTKDGRFVLTDAGALNKRIMESPDEYLTKDWEEIKRLRREKVTPEPSISENLEDVIAPELSTSTEKLDGVVTVDFADEKTGDFYDTRVGPLSIVKSEAEEKLKSIKLLPQKDYTYGDGTGRFAANINVDGEPVGSIVGALTESNTAYISNVHIQGAKLKPLATVSLWRQVAKQFKDKFGVKRFSGSRITGARRKFEVDAFVTSPELSILENQVKKIDSSIKRNPSTGVGKKIGGDLYVHQSAEDAIPDLESYKEMLPDDFTYDVVKHSPKIDAVSFIKSPNWDTVDEPLATTGLKVFSTGRIRDLNINQIYHHKWLFVRPDYAGFDVEESIRRSLAWLPLRAENKIKGLKWASIGRQEAWNKVIPHIPESSAELSVSEEDIKVANITSRGRGAIGPKAIVPRYIEENVSKKSTILDFGAGKTAEHTERLRKKGFDVTAHEFGDNVNPDIHDVNALDRKYDVVFASNVLNVQNSEGALNSTLEEISNAINEDGYTIVNFSEPRKGFLGDLTKSKAITLIEEKLIEYIGDIQRVGGIPSAPIYKVEKVSQDKKIKYGLEFSASKEEENFSDLTKNFRSHINPENVRRTIPGHWKALTDNWGVRWHQAGVDQYSSVKKYIGEEPYKLLTMTHASSGAIEGALNYGVPFMDNDGAIDLKENTLGTGLFTRFEKLGQDLRFFLEWVAANRAKYLVSVGKETGLGTIEEINSAIKDFSKGREKLFNQALKDLNEFRDAFLQIGLKSGYLSQEAHDSWTKDEGYAFYLPFYRLLEDETSTSGPMSASSIINQPEVKKYRGSNLPVKDLFSNMLQNFNFLAEASLKNQAGLKTLEQGEKIGVTRKVDKETKDSVFVRKNGKKIHYEVDEPLVLQALQALNWSGWSNPAMSTLRNFKRWLTIGVTASPAFRIRNLIRDSIHSIAVSKISYNPLGNVMQGGKGFSFKGRKMSELRAKMAFGGGQIHFGHIYGGDPNATKMLLDRNIDLNTVMESDGWGKGSLRLFKSKFGKGLNWWQEIGNTAENVNRAALYQQLRDKGVSHFEASYQARDLLNFSRHGAHPFVRFLTQSVPFLNARIQGLDKMGRAWNKEQRAQLLTTLGVYSLASIGLYLMFKDDEDFKDREQWDRDTYHWFKFPGTETAYRIPRPFEVGAVGVMFERMVEQIVDDDVHGGLFAERMAHIIGETFAFDVRPQMITPYLEVYSNKDAFTDRPVEPLWMGALPPSERKYAYTSSAYVNTSNMLQFIPWKAIQFSPVQVEHLVEGYLGWIGSSVAQVASFTDYPRKLTQFTSAESPLFMGFVKPMPSIQTRYKTEFYEAMTEMNETQKLMNLYMKNGDTDKAMKLYTKNKDLLNWRGTYVKVNSQIIKINQQIKFIEAMKGISERERYDKVKQLNLLKAEIVRTLKENVIAYEKANNTKVKRQSWWH